MERIFRRDVRPGAGTNKGLVSLPELFALDADYPDRATPRAGISISGGDIAQLSTCLVRYWRDAGRYMSTLHCAGAHREAAD